MHATVVHIAQFFQSMRNFWFGVSIGKSRLVNAEPNRWCGTETFIQQKLDSNFVHLEVQWFKHFQLCTRPYSFFYSRCQTKDGSIKKQYLFKVKFNCLYCSTSKSFENSKEVWEFAVLWFFESISWIIHIFCLHSLAVTLYIDT